jgi:cupin fold WbuC family metalloprotein
MTADWVDLERPPFQRLPGAKSTTYVVTEDVAIVGPGIIASLKKAALSDPLRRARLCLHRRPTDAVHQMIIAHHQDTYTHPHRHREKTESFHILEGRLAVVFFSDPGQSTRQIILGPVGSPDPPVYRLSASEWHTVIPLTEYVVFHEITNGPLVKGDSDLAPWAPQEGDVRAVLAYKQRLVDSLAAVPRDTSR